MSYRLNKTNGDLLVDLVDGQVDTTSTDLTLVGRNYKGFGEYLNENYIKLLENFASTAPPSNPIKGQLWFDTAEQRMKLYDGTTFKAAGGPIVSSSQPQMVAGDLWIDNENNQLHFYDGTDLVLVGPEYTAGQRKTGFEVQTVIDSVSAEKTVLKLFIAGVLVGVFADSTFRVDATRAIPGYPQDPLDTASPKRQLFETGFNPVANSFWYRGTADNARSLVNDAGTVFTEANFMQTAPVSGSTSTEGILKIKNSGGLSIGIGQTEYLILKIDQNTQQSIIETQRQDADMNFRVRLGNQNISALFVDTSTQRVGVFNNAPQYNLDVTGSGHFTSNVEIDGNLTVGGALTYIDVSNIRVQDKNIELGIDSDGNTGPDAAVDDGGIILKGSDSDKTWTWKDTTDSWTSSEHIDIASGKVFKINGVEILSATQLASTVTVAQGVTQLGTLVELDVDNINLNNNAITTSTLGLAINSASDITINSQKITGLAEPTTPTDAATKNYVDTQIDSDQVGLTLDITGLSNPYAPGVNTGPYTDVASIIETLYPASTKTGAVAKVHCTSYAGIIVNISQGDLQTAITDNNSYIAVDKDGVFSTESVVQDVAISPAGVSGSASLTPNRYTMAFISDGLTWAHTSTVNYP